MSISILIISRSPILQFMYGKEEDVTFKKLRWTKTDFNGSLLSSSCSWLYSCASLYSEADTPSTSDTLFCVFQVLLFVLSCHVEVHLSFVSLSKCLLCQWSFIYGVIKRSVHVVYASCLHTLIYIHWFCPMGLWSRWAWRGCQEVVSLWLVTTSVILLFLLWL